MIPFLNIISVKVSSGGPQMRVDGAIIHNQIPQISYRYNQLDKFHKITTIYQES